MEPWMKISLVLCSFGFLKEFRPSEPFIYEFLIGEWRDLTVDEVVHQAFPVNAYSYLLQLAIVFLITDLCRYKPLIILLGACGVVIWSMLIWTKSLLDLQIAEGVYGTYLATEVAYYTYMYAKVPNEHYQQVTGHARAAILSGKCLSAVVSQLLVSFNLMDYMELNYITLSSQILATIWAFFLPSVHKSIYFNQEKIDESTSTHKTDTNIKRAFSLLWQHFIDSYSKTHVAKWSLWWAMATCIVIQIVNYMQPLWSEIESDSDKLYNGAVEAVSMLLGTAGALFAGTFKADWELKQEIILTVCSIIQGAVLLIASQTGSIFVCYACYCVFNVLYQFMVTVASSEVAKHIMEDTYGLVFGLNTLLALIMQTILTVIVVDESIGFGLNPRDQFLVYGGYFLVLAVVYIVIGFISWYKRKNKNKSSSPSIT